MLFGTGFVQDGYLSDRAALSEQRTPSFTVAQVTLSLPLPKALLQLRLDLHTRDNIIGSTKFKIHSPTRLFYCLKDVVFL